MTRRQTRFSQKAKECSICFEFIQFQGKLSACHHLFCLTCISQWAEVTCIQTENTCPICKSRFESIQRIKHRVDYHPKKQQETVQIPNKTQEFALTHEELLSSLEDASGLIIQEVYRLLNELYYIIRQRPGSGLPEQSSPPVAKLQSLTKH